MQSETKICQNCKQNFTIEPEDFDFYKKIKVPAPTFCPRCRLERRLAFYNLFALYKRACDLCKKNFISMYPPETPYTVYCHACWWSDKWDPLTYAREYDFSRPFFDQFSELLHTVPLLGLANSSDMADAYANQAARSKNCYLIFEGDGNEECRYGFYLINAKSTLDASLIYSSDRMYDSSNCFKDHAGIGHRHQVLETIDSAFLRDARNCHDCFASANLKNKKYVAFNKQYTKEEYTAFINQYDLGSYKVYKEVEALAHEHWKKYPPDPDPSTGFSTNSSGSYVFESKNCKECYEVVGAEDCKYLLLAIVGPTKDCYDVSEWGFNLSRSYECMSVGTHASDLRFCSCVGANAYRVEYTREAFGGSDLFGCVGLRKKEYCIFNKQYTKEEYENLRAKIIEHMNQMPYADKRGNIYKYGEFFPVELSPHAYNETIAVDFFPLAKEKALEVGYRWRDSDTTEYQTTVNAGDLPDHIKNVGDSITKEIIKCPNCGRGFRILPEELLLRRRMNVPLARACPFCRIKEKYREWIENLTLVDRICAGCGTGFKTHWSETRAPHILCKPCYSKEVA